MSAGSNLTCSTGNLSRHALTEDLWTLEDELRTSGLVVAVVLIFYVLIGVPSNFFIIASIAKHKLYQQPAFIPLLSLASTDLLICIVTLPINIMSGIAGKFPLGGSDHARCQICQLGSVFTILLYVSIFSVTLISVDRFIFIRFPLRYETYVTVRGMVLAIVVAWLISIVVGILPAFKFGQLYFSPYIATCTINFSESKYFVLLLVLVVTVPISVLLVTNLWVLCIVQKHLRRIYALYRSCSSDDHKQQLYRKLNGCIRSERNRKQLNIIHAFGAIFFANIFTWLPLIGLFAASATVGLDAVPVGYAAFAYLVCVSQSVLHPLLQISAVSEIKQPILKLWRRCSGSTAPEEATPHKDCGRKHGLCGCGLFGTCSAAMLPEFTGGTDIE